MRIYEFSSAVDDYILPENVCCSRRLEWVSFLPSNVGDAVDAILDGCALAVGALTVDECCCFVVRVYFQPIFSAWIALTIDDVVYRRDTHNVHVTAAHAPTTPPHAPGFCSFICEGDRGNVRQDNDGLLCRFVCLYIVRWKTVTPRIDEWEMCLRDGGVRLVFASV